MIFYFEYEDKMQSNVNIKPSNSAKNNTVDKKQNFTQNLLIEQSKNLIEDKLILSDINHSELQQINGNKLINFSDI